MSCFVRPAVEYLAHNLTRKRKAANLHVGENEATKYLVPSVINDGQLLDCQICE